LAISRVRGDVKLWNTAGYSRYSWIQLDTNGYSWIQWDAAGYSGSAAKGLYPGISQTYTPGEGVYNTIHTVPHIGLRPVHLHPHKQREREREDGEREKREKD